LIPTQSALRLLMDFSLLLLRCGDGISITAVVVD
jgi:hypothetical protein